MSQGVKVPFLRILVGLCLCELPLGIFFMQWDYSKRRLLGGGV